MIYKVPKDDYYDILQEMLQNQLRAEVVAIDQIKRAC